jgi:hypothetical protein
VPVSRGVMRFLVPLLTSLALTPKKPVANPPVAQLFRGTAAGQGSVRLRERAGASRNPGSHSFSGTQGSISPAPSFHFPRVWDLDACLRATGCSRRRLAAASVPGCAAVRANIGCLQSGLEARMPCPALRCRKRRTSHAAGKHALPWSPANFCPNRKKLQNKAGMLMIIKRFYFWNPSKAGMYMKTQRVTRKSWNVTDDKDVILLSPIRSDFILLKARCLYC